MLFGKESVQDWQWTLFDILKFLVALGIVAIMLIMIFSR
jgi:hypothetical protein